MVWDESNGDFNLDDAKWTLMVMQADYINNELIEQAKQQLIKKGKGSDALNELRLEKFNEGKAIQTMHIGPYNEVGATYDKIKAFADENKLTLSGKCHEIYLSDPRRVIPEKLKTIVRHPVA